jgi:hypothetical protein
MNSRSFYSKFMAGILILVSTYFMILSCEMSSDELTREYGWFNFAIPGLDTTHNAVDMSFLNEKEAGETGFITVKNGHFVTGAGDPIRFFGDNLTFSNCFQDKDVSTQLAARLKKMGYNVIRFHHMDMRHTPNGIWDEKMEAFDEGQVDKLDWLIFQLKNNGIYANLNLHVSRTYPGVDYEETRAFQFGKRIDHFFRPYIEMQKKYAQMLLTHRNPYTGNTYANEPGVGFIEINNENSILSGWTALPYLKGDHRKALAGMWNTWLKENNATGWDIYKIMDLFETETPVEQKELFWKFLVETELSYAREMTDFLKNDIQIKMPVSVTQASYSGMVGVYREAEYADFVDMHSYWEHPRFPNRAWDRNDWYIRNSSMVSAKYGGTLRNFAQHRVKDMPLTISEYDHPAPSYYCAEMYPMLNSVAAFHDWDGIYHFCYGAPYEESRILNFFAAAGHPLKQVFMPVGAILFRMETIKTGESVVQLKLPKDKVLGELVEYDRKRGIGTSQTDYVWKKAGAIDALTLMRRTEVDITDDELKLSENITSPEGIWSSESGELMWDHRDSLQSIFTIDAPAAKAAAGYIGGKSIELDKVTVEMDTIPGNWGVITLTAIDGKPLDESSNILLVAAGKAENTDMGWNDEKNSVGTDWGTAPSIVEGIPAKITLLEMDDLKMFALDSAGNRGNEISIMHRKGNQVIHIGAQYKTLWYLLNRE